MRDAVRIIPLGGLGEVGKNMTVFELDGELILIDAGLTFPKAEMHGIDLVLPDFTYVADRAEQLRGIILTHGHEVGGVRLPLVEANEDEVAQIRDCLERLRLLERVA